MKKITIVSILIIAVFAATPAYALKDYEGGKWEKGLFLGASGGAMFFADDNGAGMSPSGLLGFQIGYDITHHIALRFDMSYTLGQTKVLPTVDPGVVQATSKCQFFMYNLGVKYSPVYTRFSPYLVADVGVYKLKFLNYTFENSSLRSRNNFHIAGGGGFDACLTRRNSLGIETLFHYMNANNAFSGVSLAVMYRFTF